jgi:cyclopropane fatty-acyl-phospholipid synthase-like methyltransferase
VKGHVWQQEELAKLFLEGVRGAIPLAAMQMDTLLRIVRKTLPRIDRLLDLGCGDGILGRAVLAEYPDAAGVFLDFSEPMIEAARRKAAEQGVRASFIVQDFGARDWTTTVVAPFDLVVSGFAIHHQPDERKQELYQEIFDLLKPGGLFLNQEHVSSKSAWAGQVFDELFVDSLWSHHQKQGGTKTREVIANEYYYRPDKAANILAPLDVQCRWLEEIGFVDVDCFFKLFESALFGGRRPASEVSA